jgi:hypothetical protein
MTLQAVVGTLSSKRFWVWQIAGILIYATPVVIRLATGNVVLPILGWLETPWVDHYVPANLIEKILVNAFFPGAAGAVAGEIYREKRRGSVFTRRQKYTARLEGALLWTALWSIFQLWGNLQNIMGSYGGNLFEYPMVYPLNFMLATFSIFTPDVVGYVRSKVNAAFRRKR